MLRLEVTLNTQADDANPRLNEQSLSLFICPMCHGDLSTNNDGSKCDSCRRTFEADNGVPLLFCPNDWDGKSDVTEAVKAFYEEYPFPNYEDVDSSFRLREMANRGVFARLLDEQIAYGSTVLEIGCGTGQLSNFLGMRHGRTVLGIDLCLNSLLLAEDFRQRQGIEDVIFSKMNLFRPAFRQESFELVICNGVLHHTSDPFLGFECILRLVKPGGLVVIGLYNRFGRLPTDIRRLLFKFTRGHLKFLDHRMRDRETSQKRKLAWFMDQYNHPHESTHTLGEVMGWFNKCGVEFLNSIPKATIDNAFSNEERLFAVNSKGTSFDHLVVQVGMLVLGGKEGGLFLMIGRKPNRDSQGQVPPQS